MVFWRVLLSADFLDERREPEMKFGTGRDFGQVALQLRHFLALGLLCDGGACIVSVEGTLSKSVAVVGHCSVLLIKLADYQAQSGSAGGGLVDCRVHETSTP